MDIVQHYDTLFQSSVYNELYGGSGFANWGYEAEIKRLRQMDEAICDYVLVSARKA